jgi:hypothetical protein
MADFEVVFMDAGQGDCTLIVYPDGSLTLVDCGSTKSGGAALGPIKEVIDRKFSKKEFFTMVLTHPDEDHYNLLYKLDVERYLDAGGPVAAYYGGDIDLYQNEKDGKEGDYTYDLLKHIEEHGHAYPPPNNTSIEPDELLSRAGVNVTILAANCTGNPADRSGKKKNTNSIVLLVEYQGAKIFLMGDAFIATENFITKSFKNANALSRLKKQRDEHVILKMGHHGSTTSTSKEWVELIQPDVIVVSSGTKYSRGGMPKATHLDETVAATKIEENTGINQSYVVFDDNLMEPVYVKRGATTNGIWTTCYDVAGDMANGYLESGQTWYYGVELQGKKKIPGHWVGYTGYEV